MSSKTEQYIYGLLKEIGEDPEREGLKKTPGRVTRAIAEITAGYNIDIDKVLNDAFFKADYKEMVIVRDISFYSLSANTTCFPFSAKHTLPIFPTAG